MGFLKLSGSVAHEFLAFLCRWRERANGVGSSLPVSELVRHTLEIVKHGAADRFRPDLFWPEAARLPVEQPEVQCFALAGTAPLSPPPTNATNQPLDWTTYKLLIHNSAIL